MEMQLKKAEEEKKVIKKNAEDVLSMLRTQYGDIMTGKKLQKIGTTPTNSDF